MILSFHPCFAADAQIILGSHSLDIDDRTHIREADVIILPQACSSELFQACKDSSALVFPNYDMRFKYPGKIGQSLLFKKLNFLHPETIQWPSVEKFRKACHKPGYFPHKIPFFIKENDSHEAEGIYLITGQTTLESAMNNLTLMEQSGFSGFISQDLIASEGNVLRAVIIGERLITYWKRPENPGQIITTISRGARIDKDWRIDLQEKGSMKAREFSVATGANLTAIDFVFPLSNPDPQPVFLEINYYFARRGLGGSLNYYRILLKAIQEWLLVNGFNPESVTLV